MHARRLPHSPSAASSPPQHLRMLPPLPLDTTARFIPDAQLLTGHGFSSSSSSHPPPSPQLFPSLDFGRSVHLEALDSGEQSAVTMSNITSASGEASGSSGDPGSTVQQKQQLSSSAATAAPGINNGKMVATVKKKRNLPGTPDPDAEVIALSPKTLMATNRFVCEICNKGFQRDQNLQLHRRGHNLPWKLRQRTTKEIRKRVYICPETSCVHHDPARALGDLTGIKKHFCRKHGEKKWKCEKCSKRYAVQSDWKAHSKTCGTREYRCDCGTLFSRRDSFITHRAFCDALAEESARVSSGGHFPGDHGIQAGGPLSIMDAPASPGNLIRLGGLTSATLSSSLRHGLPGHASAVGLRETGMSLVSPRWEQMSSSAPETPSSRTGLSLWLGTGPGPGQAGNELMGCSQELSTVGSASMNPMYSYSGHGGTVMAGIGQAGSIPEMGAMAGLSEFGALSNWPERGSGDRLPLTSSAGLGIRTTSGCASGPAALPSVSSLSNQTHSSSAQMSATALLQKAAQMGATASNNPLFKGFGMAGSDSSSKAFGSSWPGLSQDASRVGLPGMISSLVQNHHPLIKRGSSAALGNMGSPNGLGCDTARNTGNAGFHELLNSLPGATGILGGLGSAPTSFGHSREMGGGFLPGNGTTNERTLSRDCVGQTSQLTSQKPSFMGGYARLAKGEDGAADRFTRDFLGVGGVSSIVGSAGGMGRSMSHRDFASMVSAGIEQYNNSRENLRSVGVTGQSVGKPWDV